jgi:hypothetical protein
VSSPSAGDTPLLVLDRGDQVRVAALQESVAYNLHTDTIGSWYFPSAAKGTVCHISTWTDNGDGTLSLGFTFPPNHWVLATASNPCGEGPAGACSVTGERTTMGSWEMCGSRP